MPAAVGAGGSLNPSSLRVISGASGPEPSAARQEKLSEGQLLTAKSPGGHQLREVPTGQAPTVELNIAEDASSGWNLHVVTENFEFAPERLDEVNSQEGHAHLFLNGKKMARLYGPWFHLPASEVPVGEQELTVVLNANDHTGWAADGEAVVASTTIVGNSGPNDSTAGHNHDH